MVCHSNWLITKIKKLNSGGIMFHELKVEYTHKPWVAVVWTYNWKQIRQKDQMTNVKLDIGSDFKHNLRRKP
jgi:hypothetical protein